MVVTNFSRLSSLSVAQFFDRSEEKPTMDASGERRSWAAVSMKLRMASLTSRSSMLVLSTFLLSTSRSSSMLISARWVDSSRIFSVSRSSRRFSMARWLSPCVLCSWPASSKMLRIAPPYSCSSSPRRPTIPALVTGPASLGRAGLAQVLDLLLQLDHLELTPDGQPLELLELRQPFQLPGLLLVSLLLCLDLPGHVAGGREDAQDLTGGVAVGRGVVQDLGQRAVAVAQGQRVVHRHPLGEDQLVDPLRLLGVGEVLGEGGPDELPAGDAGGPHRALVGVGT